LGRQVRWQNTSFNFAKRWHFRPSFLSVYVCSVGRPTLAPNSNIYLVFQRSNYFLRIGGKQQCYCI